MIKSNYIHTSSDLIDPKKNLQKRKSFASEKKQNIFVKSSRIFQRNPKKRAITSKFVVIALLAGVFGSLTAPFVAQASTKEAHAFDITQYVACEVLKDVEGVKEIYQFTQTSDLQFEFLSKSAVGSGQDKVDQGLNNIIGFFNGGFDKINEPIIGYKIYPDPEDDGYVSGDADATDKDSKKERYNKGIKVNPYDRFGIAGMKFTSYAGEWKHVVVDACNPSNVNDPKAGMFYENRLEPQSTWEDRNNSYDPRTIQYSKGLFSQFGTAFANVIANGLFSVTKTIVVLTNGAINFAFSDIAKTFGLDELIGGDKGIFSALFKGVFQPLVFMMFVITAFVMLWKVFGTRQYRESWGLLVKSLILFFAAIMVSVNPIFWISIPNNVATVVQSVIVSSMNTSLAGGGGLCATDIGSKDLNIVDNKKAKPQDLITQASENMRSSLGCQFWQMLLMKPWAEAQFGTDWNNLWVKDNIPTWAKNGKALNNDNGEMTGTAEVPMGNGAVLNNWALYHISTQTNVHAPTGLEGDRPKYSNQTANDWWRIVDALSNYQEEEKSFTVGQAPDAVAEGRELPDDFNEVKYVGPKTDLQVTEQWDDWTGNNSWNRVPTALSSIFVAAIALLAPLIFALMAAIYSIGMAILIAVSPIMFLFGIWAGKGWEIFKSWAQLLLNTVMKRIAIAVLLVLSITFVSVALKVIDDIGWFQGVLLLIVSTVLLLKAKDKIMDSFASFNFSNYDMGSQAMKVKGMINKPVKDAAKLGTTALAGGAASKYAGGSFAGGANAAFKGQVKNFALEKPWLRPALMAHEAAKANIAEYEGDELANEFLSGQKNCIACGKVIAVQEDSLERNETFMVHAGRTEDGNYLCYECYTDGDHESAVEFIREFKIGKQDTEKEKFEKQMKNDSAKYASRFTARSDYNNSIKDKTAEVKNTTLSNEERLDALNQQAIRINIDINRFRKGETNGVSAEIPEELSKYINPVALQTAWDQGQDDYIRMTYASAWSIWAKENIDDNDSLRDEINPDLIFAAIKDAEANNSDDDSE